MTTPHYLGLASLRSLYFDHQQVDLLCDTRQLPGLGNLFTVDFGEALEVPGECGQQEGGC